MGLSRPPISPVSPSAGQETFSSETTTTSTSMSTTASPTTSVISAGPSHLTTFSAPTPYNTFLASQVDPETYSFASPDRDADGSARLSSDEEILYQVGEGDGDVSLQPSISPSLSTSASLPSRQFSYYSSSQASAHLLPSPSSRSDLDSPSSSDIYSVPHSSRPIPAPLQTLSSSQSASISTSDPFGNPSPNLNPNSALDSTISATASSHVDSVSSQPPNLPSGECPFRWSRGFSGRDRTKNSRVKQDDKDAHRLQQLGYDAVLGREYTFLSSVCISTLNIGCIQGTIYAVKNAYSYGGPSMILVAWPLSGVFSIFLVLVLSEFASTYPVTGAMASWGWKLARGGVGGERGWGWVLGGFVLGGHAASAILVTWEICDIIAGTMAISFKYQAQPWHEVLFYVAAMLLLGTVGMTSWGRSHRFWLSAGAYGLVMWLVLCITLLVSEAKRGGVIRTDVYFDRSGWSSRPYVYLLGWQYSTIASGFDASAHMAEETKNPSRNVPGAMVMSMVLTYLLGYVSIILLLLAISPEDGESVANHPFAFGYILARAISPKGSIVICSLLVVVLLLQVLAQLQASSRFIFALARDNAIPFSESIRRTNVSKQPVMANWVAIGLCAPFALLLIGGKGFLYSLLAVTASSLSYAGYITPAILYLLSGKDLQTEGRTSWSLRRWSKPVACVGVLYGLAVIVVQMLPGEYPVAIDNISWTPVVLVGTVIICFITWKCYGNKHYSGPIRAVTKWETGVEIDIGTTLASRSRASGNALELEAGPDPFAAGANAAADDDSKLGITPFFETTADRLTPMVTVTSARSFDEAVEIEAVEVHDHVQNGQGMWSDSVSGSAAAGSSFGLRSEQESGRSSTLSGSSDSSTSADSGSTVTRRERPARSQGGRQGGGVEGS